MFYLTSDLENKSWNNNALILMRWTAIFFKIDNTNCCEMCREKIISISYLLLVSLNQCDRDSDDT